MPKVIMGGIIRDGNRLVVDATVEFDGNEWTADQAESAVKSALGSLPAKSPTLAAMRLDPVQAGMNRKLGLSDAVFARYNRP